MKDKNNTHKYRIKLLNPITLKEISTSVVCENLRQSKLKAENFLKLSKTTGFEILILYSLSNDFEYYMKVGNRWIAKQINKQS